MSQYKTEGRQKLLSFLLNHPDKQYTVDEIREELSRINEDEDRLTPPKAIGKSSLYRQLAELCDDGTVRKFRAEAQASFVYQFVGQTDCGHHFHLKCLVCGRLVHLECKLSDELLEHIREEHGFRVDSGRSILYGCCEDCAAHLNDVPEPAEKDEENDEDI